MKKKAIKATSVHRHVSSPLLKANKFSRAGFHISLFYKRRLKYFSTEYLSGVKVETILTTVVVFPRLMNWPAPRALVNRNTMEELTACVSLLKNVPHIKPKDDPVILINKLVKTQSKKFAVDSSFIPMK
jgi:hypothetical protein